MTTDTPQRRLLLTPASQIRSTRQKWLQRDIIPLGTATIFAGKGGEGKSTYALDLAARLTRGELEGDLQGRKSSVVIIGPEDDWATIMKPRLQAAGADLDHVWKVDIATTFDEVTREVVPRFPIDTEYIRDAITETNAKLLILDPAPTLMAGDMNKVQDVRQAYGPLIALAQHAEMAVILINHFGKGGGSVSAKLSGSHAWRDLTRSYLAFATDEETGNRIFTQDKNNYATGKGSYQFTLDSVTVPTDDGDTTTVAKVRFLGETDVSVGDLINRETHDEDDAEDRNAAQAFLLEFLREHDEQEAKAADAIKAGRAAGFNDNDMKNARKRCRNPRVVSVKSSFGAGWVWRIEPEGVTQGVEDVTSASTDTFDTFDTFVTPSPPTPGPKVAPVQCAVMGCGETVTPFRLRHGRSTCSGHSAETEAAFERSGA